MLLRLLILIFIVLINFSCETNPTTCGVVDNCGVCDEDPSNDCTQDCFGIWGGLNLEDCSGTCAGNAKLDCNNVCITPDEGIYSGDFANEGECDCQGNVLDDCGVCGGDGPNKRCGCFGRPLLASGGTAANYKIMGTSELSSHVSGILLPDIDIIEAGCGLLTNLVISSNSVEGFQGLENIIIHQNSIASNPISFDYFSKEDYCTDNSLINDGCDLPINTLYVVNGRVLYNSSIDIKGFDFDLIDSYVPRSCNCNGDSLDCSFNSDLETDQCITFTTQDACTGNCEWKNTGNYEECVHPLCDNISDDIDSDNVCDSEDICITNNHIYENCYNEEYGEDNEGNAVDQYGRIYCGCSGEFGTDNTDECPVFDCAGICGGPDQRKEINPFFGGGLCECRQELNDDGCCCDISRDACDICGGGGYIDACSQNSTEDGKTYSEEPNSGFCCSCSGSLWDLCGVCGGNDSCYDCNNQLNGDAVEDECGTCDNDSSNDCTQDCDGVWGGSAEEDSCGVCNGSGECPCPDNEGLNSCNCCCDEGEFQDNCADCHVNPADACQEDCAGIWGGTNTQDQCGVCDDNPSNDNTTCCPTDVCLSFEECLNSECSDKKLVYDSNSDIFGFQFNHSDCISIAGGGQAANAGFIIQNSSSVILGFSFSGGSITEDSGIFLELTEGNNSLIPECLSNFQFSGSDGITLEVDYNISEEEEEELTGCDLPENNIYILDENVLYNIPSDFSLFRFDINGANVQSVSGGDAQEGGFSLTANFESSFLSADIFGQSSSEINGCGVLVALTLDGEPTGAENIFFLNNSFTQIPVEYYQP